MRKWVYDLVYGKEGTPAQKRAAKLAGARRQFRIGLYVCVLSPYNTCGNVTDHRLENNEVQIEVNAKWYPKYLVTKDPRVMRAVKRKQ